MEQEMNLLGLSGRRWMVDEKRFLRLLTAYEIILCEAEAKNLCNRLGISAESEALAGNAVLVSMALVDENGNPVFRDGESVFKTLSADEINQLAESYALCREKSIEDMETVKKNLSRDSDRIRWTVLRAFGKLPTDESVQRMSEGDFLYCYLNLLIDSELENEWEYGLNPNFNSEVEMDIGERKTL